jgi:2-polyprenyl-3-methyl-5-hydroxy-6-metoxy-1,4-benzoquinol methylase
MAEQSSRPFYGEYAWAFDLLIDRPVGQECAAITAWFSERGVLPGATLLDAGCGTGRYAGELARRGYAVEGVDRSSELIETARQSVASDDPKSNQATRGSCKILSLREQFSSVFGTISATWLMRAA